MAYSRWPKAESPEPRAEIETLEACTRISSSAYAEGRWGLELVTRSVSRVLEFEVAGLGFRG